MWLDKGRIRELGAQAAEQSLGRQVPDLMILDLKLEDGVGPALVTRLRGHRAAVPFVIVTGQGDEKVAVEVMKQGALDYVMKDTGLIDLLPTVVRRAKARGVRLIVATNIRPPGFTRSVPSSSAGSCGVGPMDERMMVWGAHIWSVCSGFQTWRPSAALPRDSCRRSQCWSVNCRVRRPVSRRSSWGRGRWGDGRIFGSWCGFSWCRASDAATGQGVAQP